MLFLQKMQNFRALGAPLPDPQTPIGLWRLGAPRSDPPNSPSLRISGYAPVHSYGSLNTDRDFRSFYVKNRIA